MQNAGVFMDSWPELVVLAGPPCSPPPPPSSPPHLTTLDPYPPHFVVIMAGLEDYLNIITT